MVRVAKRKQKHLGFSYCEFKIRLGLSFQKQKFLYLYSQPTDSQSGDLIITPKSPLWETQKKLKPRADVNRTPKTRSISYPTKRTDVLQKK